MAAGLGVAKTHTAQIPRGQLVPPRTVHSLRPVRRAGRRQQEISGCLEHRHAVGQPDGVASAGVLEAHAHKIRFSVRKVAKNGLPPPPLDPRDSLAICSATW